MALALALGTGCEKADQDTALESHEPSPNASILPAPLASATELLPVSPSATPVGSLIGPLPSAAPAPAPRPLNVLRALPPDPNPIRETPSWVLTARWSWPWLVARARHGVRATELKRLSEQSPFEVLIELRAAGRLRWEFLGNGFPVARGSEIRSRSDYFGHALVWPAGIQYRLLAPGALHSLLLEGRADAVPLMRGTYEEQVAAPRQHLGFQTKTVEISTLAGQLQLEQARVEGSGLGGVLLCRLLVELLAVEPGIEACAPEWVPVRARYRKEGKDVAFEVHQLIGSNEVGARVFTVPPEGARFTASGLPVREHLLLSREAFSSLRGSAAEEPTVLVNRGAKLRYAAVQGLPVSQVGPHGELRLPLPAGTYDFAWTDFFGSRDVHPPPPEEIEAPGRYVIGPLPAPDAGLE